MLQKHKHLLKQAHQSLQITARRVVENAQAMCEVFVSNGFKVLTGGTDSHIILMDLSESKYSGREAADLLEENGITVNKNGVPNDPRSFVETSGIRIVHCRRNNTW